MTGIIVGIILIVGGLGYAVLGVMAAGMASRQATTWENFGPLAIGGPIMLIGAVLIVWG